MKKLIAPLTAIFAAVTPIQVGAFNADSTIDDWSPFYEVNCERGGRDLEPHFYVTHGYDSFDSAYLTMNQEEFRTLFGNDLQYTGNVFTPMYSGSYQEAILSTPLGDFRMAIRDYSLEGHIDHIVIIMNESDLQTMLLQTEQNGISINGWSCHRKDFEY